MEIRGLSSGLDTLLVPLEHGLTGPLRPTDTSSGAMCAAVGPFQCVCWGPVSVPRALPAVSGCVGRRGVCRPRGRSIHHRWSCPPARAPTGAAAPELQGSRDTASSSKEGSHLQQPADQAPCGPSSSSRRLLQTGRRAGQQHQPVGFLIWPLPSPCVLHPYIHRPAR